MKLDFLKSSLVVLFTVYLIMKVSFMNFGMIAISINSVDGEFHFVYSCLYKIMVVIIPFRF